MSKHNQVHRKANAEALLSRIRPGHVWHLNLTTKEAKTLKDKDGRLALSLLQHFLHARAGMGLKQPWEPFPLTAEMLRRVSVRLEQRIGQKRSYVLLRRLREAGVLQERGRYQNARGCRVTLWTAISRSLRSLKASVGRRRTVKYHREHREWAHPLFGMPNGRPPPEWRGR